MRVWDKLSLSVQGLLRAGLPTVLCLIAITVSTFTAGTIYHVSAAANSFVDRELSRIGIAGITLYTKEPILDLEATLRQLDGIAQVKEVMPLAMISGTVRGREGQIPALLMGVGADVTRVYQLQLLHGRSFTKAELAAGEPVVLVDDQFALELYGRTNIVGKTARLGASAGYRTATVIGVYRSQKQGLESTLGIAVPEIIYLPINTLGELTDGISVDKIAISCLAHTDQEQVARMAAADLTRSTGQTFRYENISGYYDLVSRVTATVGQAILAIGLVAVLVGGLGLMIAMLSAVDQRRQTIGIYMALGAATESIVTLYLLEGIELCLLGGGLGSLLSICAMELLGTVFPLDIQSGVLGSVMAAAVLLGVFFGILPALKAARLDPIQALQE